MFRLKTYFAVCYQEMLDAFGLAVILFRSGLCRWRSGQVVDQQAVVGHRYRAVCEVLGGSPISEVAVRYGSWRIAACRGPSR